MYTYMYELGTLRSQAKLWILKQQEAPEVLNHGPLACGHILALPLSPWDKWEARGSWALPVLPQTKVGNA